MRATKNGQSKRSCRMVLNEVEKFSEIFMKDSCPLRNCVAAELRKAVGRLDGSSSRTLGKPLSSVAVCANTQPKCSPFHLAEIANPICGVSEHKLSPCPLML